MRHSSRGGAAQQLNHRECAVIALAMRGEANVAETDEFATLTRNATPHGQCLADRLAELIQESAEALLAGSQPDARTIILRRGGRPGAEVRSADMTEIFGSPKHADDAKGIRKITEIPPDVWGVLCELCADSVRKTRDRLSCKFDHQGDAPGATKMKTPDRPASQSSVKKGCQRPNKTSGTAQNQSSTPGSSRKQFVGTAAGKAPANPRRTSIERGPYEIEIIKEAPVA